MLVPDRKCGHQMSILNFRQFSVGGTGGVYELPCRVGEVTCPFENTKKLLPPHSPSISLVLGIF